MSCPCNFNSVCDPTWSGCIRYRPRRLVYECVVPRRVLQIVGANLWQHVAAATGNHVSAQFCRRVIVAKGATLVEHNTSLHLGGVVVVSFLEEK